jgi:hypothetical protein
VIGTLRVEPDREGLETTVSMAGTEWESIDFRREEEKLARSLFLVSHDCKDSSSFNSHRAAKMS